MTIKEFAKLCGCNPQTLRYYDHQDLLKPAKVDAWSGYRYYDEQQSLVFIKIKNLQKAGFPITEIKELLQKDDTAIYQAFERKITEAEAKIREIRAVQRSYQTEISTMKDTLAKLHTLIDEARETIDPLTEFGIDDASYAAFLDQMDTMLHEIAEDGDASHFTYNDYTDEAPGTEERYFESILHDPAYTVMYEKHGWQHMKDILDAMPVLNGEGGYLLLIRLCTSTPKAAFANTIIGMCSLRAGMPIRIGCTVLDAIDNSNHFWLVHYATDVRIPFGNIPS